MFCRSGLRAAIGAAAIAAWRPLLRKALLHAADGLFFCTRTAAAIAAWRPLLRKALLHAADGLFFCTRTAAAIAAWRPRLRKALLHAADGLFFCTRTAPAIRHEPRPAPSPLEPAQCRPSRPAEAGIRHQTPNPMRIAARRPAACKSAFAYFSGACEKWVARRRAARGETLLIREPSHPATVPLHRRFVLMVASAAIGSSGHGCFGYRPRMSLATSG